MTYKNLKVLSIQNLFFKLPDDFDGGLVEALRILADYHEGILKFKSELPIEDRRRCVMEENIKEYDYDKVWYFFLEGLENQKMLASTLAISEYDSETNEMKLMKGFDINPYIKEIKEYEEKIKNRNQDSGE